MLQTPQKGFQRSVNTSNVRKNYLADWLEAIVLFDKGFVTKNEVVDILIEYQVCSDDGQDLAHSIASQGWDEVRLRKDCGGIPASLSISMNRLEDGAQWASQPLRSFFLLLSIARIFPDWSAGYVDHVTQGNLFEEVVEVICPALLPGWSVFRAGWSPTNTKNPHDIIRELCDRIHVSGATDADEWLAPHANDAGLDIVCYRPFPDRREATPVYFFQCASGKNWREKVTTPNAELWQKVMNSAVRPGTAIATPFVIDELELKMASLVGQAVVFDRLRMLDAAAAQNINLPNPLQDRLVDWMGPRINSLPKAT